MRIDKHCTNIRIFRKKFQRRKYKFKKFRFKTIIEVPKWETSIQESIELSNYRIIDPGDWNIRIHTHGRYYTLGIK